MLHLITMSTLHLVRCVCHGYTFLGGVQEESQCIGNSKANSLSFLAVWVLMSHISIGGH